MWMCVRACLLDVYGKKLEVKRRKRKYFESMYATITGSMRNELNAVGLHNA